MRKIIFVALVVLLATPVLASPPASAAPTSWAYVTLRPLPGDHITNVVDANDVGTALGFSSIGGETPGNSRPVVWDAAGNPTALLLPPGVLAVQPRVIANDGTILGWSSEAGLIVWRNGQPTAYPEITGQAVAMTDDGLILFTDGTLRRIDGGLPTVLPRESPIARFLDMDPATGRVVGTDSRLGEPVHATLWDETGAHQLSPTWWSYGTGARAIRGDFVAVDYTVTASTPETGACQAAALHHRGGVYALDAADAYSRVEDVTSFGVAVGERHDRCNGPTSAWEAVAYVYGSVIPVSQLAAPPEGVSPILAMIITERAWIYGHSYGHPEGDFAYLVRPVGLAHTG